MGDFAVSNSLLSQKDILALIEEFSKTPEGAKEIKQYVKGEFIAQEVSDTHAKSVDDEDITLICQDMKNILFKHISKMIKSFRPEDIIVSPPKVENGICEVEICFDEEALHRKSLDPKRYPEGIHDIVKLFVTGYHAKGAVKGVWEGHGDDEIWSRRSREPSNFMDLAVKEFNRKYGQVALAELGEDYRK